jgi:hypothetical protein
MKLTITGLGTALVIATLTFGDASAMPMQKQITIEDWIIGAHLCHSTCEGICGAGRHKHGSAPFCFVDACTCASTKGQSKKIRKRNAR